VFLDKGEWEGGDKEKAKEADIHLLSFFQRKPENHGGGCAMAW
jgi:hypothetical protein